MNQPSEYTVKSSGGPRSTPHTPLRVDDALRYLELVKQQTGDRPEVYTQFLDAMNDFKLQAIDTLAACYRVSTTLRGYPDLLIGFNQGCRREREARTDTEALRRHGHPSTMSNPVEIPDAIDYVATIKQRFAHKPETYSAFLNILHQVQFEKESIGSVMNQVSQLFGEHPDLVQKFTTFLPSSLIGKTYTRQPVLQMDTESAATPVCTLEGALQKMALDREGHS